MRRLFGALVAVCAFSIAAGACASEVEAQGRSNGRAHSPPRHAKKVVTADHAILVTREVLVQHGYEVVRVELVSNTRVVYYRAGNMGRGRGKGPVERLVIRPSSQVVVFEAAPPRVLVDINVRLGL